MKSLLRYLALFVALCVSVPALAHALIQAKLPRPVHERVMFVVGGSYGYIKKENKFYTLSMPLNAIKNLMVFTKRPYRYVRYDKIAKITQVWNGPTVIKNFSKLPPNAALSTSADRPAVVTLLGMMIRKDGVHFIFAPIKPGMFHIPKGGVRHVVLTIDQAQMSDSGESKQLLTAKDILESTDDESLQDSDPNGIPNAIKNGVNKLKNVFKSKKSNSNSNSDDNSDTSNTSDATDSDEPISNTQEQLNNVLEDSNIGPEAEDSENTDVTMAQGRSLTNVQAKAITREEDLEDPSAEDASEGGDLASEGGDLAGDGAGDGADAAGDLLADLAMAGAAVIE